MNWKIVLLAFALILVGTTGVSALTIAEKGLATYQFMGIQLSPDHVNDCQSFTFIPFNGYKDTQNDTQLNLGITFLPLDDFDSNVDVRANGQRIGTIYSRDFNAQKDAHIIIPAELQNEHGTRIDICAHASPTLESLHVSSSGTLGLYQQPHFDRPTDFETVVITPERILGQEIQAQVHLHNSGSLPAQVHVDYRKYDVPYLPLLKGETGFDVQLEAGESKDIKYIIKPLRAVDLALPPAVLTYTNIFGEKETIESNRAQVTVREPQFNVKGAFILNQTHAIVNTPIEVRWLAQNDGIDPLYGLNASLSVTPDSSVHMEKILIGELQPSHVESRTFNLTFDKPGTYTLGCVIYQQTNPELRANCQGTTITITEDSRVLTLILSLLLVVIGIGVYAYIYYAKPRVHHEVKPKKRFQS